VILFVENLAGLDIATHAPELARRRLLKITTPQVLAYAEPGFRERGWVLALAPSRLRILKPLLSLLQLPVIQQDPFGKSFRLGAWKQVLSDGLLTEYIVKRLGAPVRRFYSLASIRSGAGHIVPGHAIVGSNWLEFGSMSLEAYRAHLEFLNRQYPEAPYYCHPKERRGVAEDVFGPGRVKRPDRPVEAWLRAHGIPACIVGVCSSSLLSLAVAHPGQVRIELVTLQPQQFDGPQGDTIYTMKRPATGQSRVSVGDLQQFLHDELRSCGVSVLHVPQPLWTEAH
jgi:hypothetical protein